jgi:hypothetical protein
MTEDIHDGGCDYDTPRRCGHRPEQHKRWPGHTDTVCEICYLARGADSDPWHEFTLTRTNNPATLTVYVPTDSSAEALLGIKPGSGIVGSPEHDDPLAGMPALTDELTSGRIRIDYEGNLYFAHNLTTFEERVYHAADRHLYDGGRGYPTIARKWVPRRWLREVGVYDYATRRLVADPDPNAAALLAAWVARYRPGGYP